MLRSELSLEPAGDGPGASGLVQIQAGERKYFSLMYNREAPAVVVPPLGESARGRIEQTARWWRESGPHGV